MPGTLLYRSALITGASSGLGGVFARQLAPVCERIVLVARRQDRLAAVEAELREINPALQVASAPVDLTLGAARQDLIDRLLGTAWAPDLLINNAGMGDYGDFARSDWRKVDSMMKVNISAVTHLSHGFLPEMIGAGRGWILNVSSLASVLPIPDFAVYAASKAYVTSFSEALRLEVRHLGVTVMATCPGPVHTEFGEIAARGGQSRDTPLRDWFYLDGEHVVRQSLGALRCGRPRIYPGWKVALFAAGLSLLPLALIRCGMSYRPRQERAEPAM